MSLTAEQKKAAEEAEAVKKAEEEAASEKKKAKQVRLADWQEPGYNGPLDINQAQWRLKNIKPMANKKTK